MNIQEMSLELERKHENRTNCKIYLVKDYWFSYSTEINYFLHASTNKNSLILINIDDPWPMSHFIQITLHEKEILFKINLIRSYPVTGSN
jgi:hypothetical protein